MVLNIKQWWVHLTIVRSC